MLWGLHHTVNVRPKGPSSLRFLSALFFANAGVEYMGKSGFEAWTRPDIRGRGLSPILSPFDLGVNAERTTSPTSKVECDDSSGGNTVLETSFQFLVTLLKDVLRALCFVLSKH